MSGNTSSNAGYLTPLTSPTTQVGIEDALHDIVCGITGLGATLVRPRWQPEPPKQPERAVNWCSIGILDRQPQGFPAVTHDGTGRGKDTVTTWETLDVIASFYGPNGQDLAVLLRDGLYVEQNRVGLRTAGLALGEVGRMTNVPELINGTWVPRVDLALVIRSEARREFGVLNIVCGPAVIETDTGLIAQTAPMN